jgi:beta-lactamase superfamily II metal-dependent hydrolase
MKSICTLVLVLVLGPTLLFAAGTLDVYVINVDHGNAVLVVTPAGQSMLLDAGPPGKVYVDRILAAIADAGVKQIDYSVVSHYDWDHFATLPELVKTVPIRNFVDHGPELKKDDAAKSGSGKRNPLLENYLKVRATGNHIVPVPGDKIPLTGVDVQVVSCAGKVLSAPLKGGGGPNPACWLTDLVAENEEEDALSVGVLIEFGKFRFIDLGDLTWNMSYRLFCPENKIGTVDLYLITHHGLSYTQQAVGEAQASARSCPPCEVYGLRPRVAILTAGEDYVARLSTPAAWQRIRLSPGLEDIWQTNYQAQGGAQNNAPEQFIACLNVATSKGGDWIKASAKADGSFTVTNQRNGFTKQYPPNTQP